MNRKTFATQQEGVCFMFEITVNPRPQVLLLGNGLNRTFGGFSWSELVKSLSLRQDLPENLTCPMPLQAVLVSNGTVAECMKNNKDRFYGHVSQQLMVLLQQLLSIGFTDILTTNYSYELEAASQCSGVIYDYFLKKTCRNVNDGERVESKYLLSSCQYIQFRNTKNRIWHIHGEARKPNSMILDHYCYAGLLCRMKNYVDSRYGAYLSYLNDKKLLTLRGWLDSFILGDVYILGFSMDFSELDLWWLIDKKKREKRSDAHVYFYDFATQGFNEKHELLKLMGVKVCTLGMERPPDDVGNCNEIYEEFYKEAISDIRKNMPVLEPV